MRQRLLLLIFIAVPFCIKAQLKEIRAIQQQLSTIKDSVAYVDAINRLGMLYHLKSVDSCFYYGQQANAIANRLNYQKGRADALNNLAIVHLLKQNIYLGAKYFNDALDIYRNLKDTANECQLLMNIGIAQAMENKIPGCIRYLKQAYTLGSHLKNDSILSLVILNTVNYDTTLSADSANGLLNKAGVISTRYNDYRSLAAITQTRGEVLVSTGKKQEGIDTIKKALQITKDLGIEYGKISADLELGDIYFGNNDSTQGIYYYKDALATATADGYQTFQIATAQKLYDYYVSKNNMALSAWYAGVLIKTYQDYQQAIQQSGVDYMDYSIKTAEIENLKSDRRKNIYIIVILSALSLVIIVLLVFVLSAQRSRKKYVELLQQRNTQAGNRYAELQSKNEFNNRLISLLAHDFRQPMAAVKGMMSLLKEPGVLSEKEISLLVNKIETSSDTSLEIFDNILHWIKKQVSGFTYEPVSMQLNELVDEAAKSLQYITDKFNITVINNITDATIIQADKEMLQFINRNLIHNAVKFSPGDATITISAIKSGGEIIVSVKDEGKGMSTEKIDALFNIFSKKQYASDKEKGSGVALVICKDFLERMHGRIWAESEQGNGSTFLYALPLND